MQWSTWFVIGLAALTIAAVVARRVRRRRLLRRREEALEFVRSLNAKAAEFYVDEKGDIRWK